MGTNCAPLLVDLFLYFHDAEFIQNILHVHEKKRPLSVTLNLRFRYIENVLSINNKDSYSYVDSIYPSGKEIKDNKGSYMSVSFLYIIIDKLKNQLYDKRGDFNFSIVNFPYL